MKATINITTPAGRNLEGFPREVESMSRELGDVVFSVHKELGFYCTTVHKGDTITIKIEE